MYTFINGKRNFHRIALTWTTAEEFAIAHRYWIAQKRYGSKFISIDHGESRVGVTIERPRNVDDALKPVANVSVRN